MTTHVIRIQITTENSNIPHILALNPSKTFSTKRSQCLKQLKFSSVTKYAKTTDSKLYKTSLAYEEITALNSFTAHDCIAVLVTASNCINIYWSIKTSSLIRLPRGPIVPSSNNNKADRVNFIFFLNKIQSISTAAIIKIQMRVGKTPYINKWKFNLRPSQRRLPWWQSSPPLLSDQC